MTTYSVADAKNSLPSLINRALEGEEVVISRHGRPVVELRSVRPPPPANVAGAHEWLRQRREGRPAIGVTSVEILDEMYEGDDD